MFNVGLHRFRTQLNVLKMRRILGPLKKYFLLTLVFAVVLLFLFQLKEGDTLWKKIKGSEITTSSHPNKLQTTIEIKPVKSSLISAAIPVREQSPEKNDEVYEIDEIDGSITDSPDAKHGTLKRVSNFQLPNQRRNESLSCIPMRIHTVIESSIS
uniref:Uncharacterized protein n=1 Tax=Megaselia scalaris TaxID=36166 RepID=T1GGR4_MEGSC